MTILLIILLVISLITCYFKPNCPMYMLQIIIFSVLSIMGCIIESECIPQNFLEILYYSATVSAFSAGVYTLHNLKQRFEADRHKINGEIQKEFYLLQLKIELYESLKNKPNAISTTSIRNMYQQLSNDPFLTIDIPKPQLLERIHQDLQKVKKYFWLATKKSLYLKK